MNINRQLPKGAWLAVGLLFVVGLLNYLDRTMIATMRGSIVDAIPMTDAQFGLLTSVFLWVYGLLSPFAGFMADRFSRSKIIIGSLLVWSFVTWLTAHATTYNQLLATRALMGISEAFYIPAALALIVDYHTGQTRSFATGLHIAGMMVGQSLGFIGGWMAETRTWDYAFNFFGIAGMAYAVLLVFLLKDAPRAAIPAPAKSNTAAAGGVKFGKAVGSLFSSRAFIVLLVFWGLLGVVGWLVAAWLPTYYKEQFGLSQSMAGFFATTCLYPASIAGLLAGGALSDKWSGKNRYARLLVPIIGLVIAAPAVFLASYVQVLAWAVVFFMVYGFTRMFTDTNLMPILCMAVDDRYKATGYGILNMFATIIGGVGIYAAGAFRDSDIDLSVTLRLAALLIVVCAALLWIVKSNIKTERQL